MNREEEEKEKKVMKGSIYKFGADSPGFSSGSATYPAV